MSHITSGRYRKVKWYNSNVFPLVPVIEYRKSDKYNTSSFTLRWLLLTVWTLDSFCFEFAITADTHWGFGFKGLLPYLRWCFAIPCPEKLGIFIDRKLSRRKKIIEYEE